MTRAKQEIIDVVMASFDEPKFEDDFVTQITVNTKSGDYIFTIEDESVTVTNSENELNKTFKFTAFIKWLKGFTESFEKKATDNRPTRHVDMNAIEINLTRNQALFLEEVALVALNAKTDSINPADAISFNECQVRGLLTTLVSKNVLSKHKTEKGMNYSITASGYRWLGYPSPVEKEKKEIRRPIDGKPTKSIAEEFSGLPKETRGSSNKNPRAEYSKGEAPSQDDYDEAILDLKREKLAKNGLCKRLILLGFDNEHVIKAVKKINKVDIKEAEVNKQRRALKRKGELN